MLAAICLDHQYRLDADEIGDIRPYPRLTPEFPAVQSAVA
jgi:hypothetical protein